MIMLEITLIVYKLRQFYCHDIWNNFIVTVKFWIILQEQYFEPIKVKEETQGKIISLQSETFIHYIEISHICPVLAQNNW